MSHTVLGYINTLLLVYSWLIIGRVLLSWIPSQAPVFRSIYGFFYTVSTVAHALGLVCLALLASSTVNT